MVMQDTIVIEPNKLIVETYYCIECNKVFYYRHLKQDIAIMGLKSEDTQKIEEKEIPPEKEITIELPLLANFFLAFINLFVKDNTFPELDEKGVFSGCMYDRKCEVYYKIPYEVK